MLLKHLLDMKDKLAARRWTTIVMKSDRITDLPAGDRSREKLLVKGAESLTDAELLAIFLRLGVRGKSAVMLARELLDRFGSLRGLYSAPADELRSVSGMGDAKIAQFKAVTEMSKRYLEQGFKDRAYVESSEDILRFLYQEMRDLDQESFRLVLLNGQNHVLNIVEVARGTLTASSIYPREVVKTALRYSAGAVVFVHNHPSGAVEPSEEDKKITRRLVLACEVVGIRVHDHIIIGENTTFSFADCGLLDEYTAAAEEKDGA